MENLKEMVPSFLYELLLKSYGEEETNEILEGYLTKRVTSLRMNLIKTTLKDTLNFFHENNIDYEMVDFYKDAFIILNKTAKELLEYDFIKNGNLYIQGLTSMIPPLLLDLTPDMDLLDMAAAPGGKTCQIASMMNNKIHIMAVEASKPRFERLKYNVLSQGAISVNLINQDSRKLDDFFRFDSILLDAPCSGSGTLHFKDGKITDKFSYELVLNSQKLQKALLKKALQILKPGKTLVYSTCSILPLENEDVLNSLLNKNYQIEPINENMFSNFKLLKSKIPGTVIFKPNAYYEGFFVAKIKKIR